MKKRKSAVLLLSLTCAATTLGYGSWVVNYYYNFVQTNKVQDVPVAYIVGKEDIKYTTIEKALEVAQSGNIVCVIPPTLSNYHSANNNIVPDKVTYEISRDCEIKPGVSLVIPTDKDTFSSVSDSKSLNTFINSMSNDSRGNGGNYALEATSNEKYYLRVTIKIKKNVKLTNNGNLIVSGYLGGGNNAGGMVGQTTHSYSQIILEENASILQKNSNANLYCYGYIKEEINDNSSVIDLQLGNLYIPLIIYDYKGFPFSYSLTNGALSTEHCSPFNQFGVKNIEVKTKLSYESKTYGISNLYLSYQSMNVEKIFNNKINLVGNDTSFFIYLNNSEFSSIVTKIDKNTNNFSLDIFGGCMLNNINLKLQATSSLKVDLSTTDSFLPITYRQHISLNCALGQELASYDFTKQRIKLLPASSLTINSKCNVSASDFAIYTAFYDGTLGNGNNIANGYNSYKYPIKKGATMCVNSGSKFAANSLGGQIYCDDASLIKCSNNTVISKEPWNIKTGSSLNPWLTDDYLEIREKLNISPIGYLEKQKLFCGFNTFTKTNGFLPKINVILNDGSIIESVDAYQRVIFLDNISNYSVDFVNNIYKVLFNNSYYKKNQIINYSEANSILCSINSDLSISNNNNGINEFNVQSVEITCTTPLIDGNVPLYPGSTIQLEANIIDINKVYDKEITWESSDNNIATIDKNGTVTGIALGDVIFSATCDGVTGFYEAKVINSVELIPITTIRISDNKGNSASLDTTTSNSISVSLNKTTQYSNKTNVTFTISLNEGANWSSIEWYFRASAKGRQYLTDNTLAEEYAYNEESVTVHVVSGSGKDDDAFTLNCSITDLSNGKTYKINMTLYHKADGCFESGTLITTKRGLVKVEDLKQNDLIKSYNHKIGTYEYKPIAALIDHGEKIYKVINLDFSDGSNIGFITCHGLFDLDENKYVDINENNYLNYIGHRFAKGLGSEYEEIVLVNASIIEKITNSYTVLSSENINCEANGILNITSVLVGIYNIFDYDKNHNFDITLMKQDIERYGLYTYDDFKDRIDEKKFYDLGFKYFKVAIGKGILTDKILQFYIDWFHECIKNGEAIIY